MNYQSLSLIILALLTLHGCRAKKKESTFEKAVVALENDNHQEALNFLDKALLQDPQPRYYALKGTLLYQSRDFKGSKKVFEKLLKQKNLNPVLRAEVTNNYACALNQLGNHTQAQGLWNQLLRDDNYSTKEVAWFNLGMIAFEQSKKLQKKQVHKSQQDAKVAVKRFKKALAIEPQYVDALFYRAQAELICDNKAAAIHSLNKLISIVPDHEPANELINLCS
jgi:tetratricopeptide (TPR) repeat protein